MGTQKILKLDIDTISEIKLIAALTNAKSVNSFLEDLMLHLTKKSEFIFDIPARRKDVVTYNFVVDDLILYELRIMAVNVGMSLKAYMESVITWLANEHCENGRVWIDDTDARVLPIRRRK